MFTGRTYQEYLAYVKDTCYVDKKALNYQFTQFQSNNNTPLLTALDYLNTDENTEKILVFRISLDSWRMEMAELSKLVITLYYFERNKEGYFFLKKTENKYIKK